MVACPSDWLVEGLSLADIEAKLGRDANHPNWLRVKELARPGDEYWWFRSPPHTWPRKVGAVEDGVSPIHEGVESSTPAE
jgi:hypothetical protein